MHRAVKVHDLGCIKMLIEEGAEIDGTDANGDTPLKTAINRKYYWDAENSSNPYGCEAIMLLVKLGANPKNLNFAAKNNEKYGILQKCQMGKYDCYSSNMFYISKNNIFYHYKNKFLF